MITLKDFLETIDYKITEGSEYGWKCYGENTHRIERQSGDHMGNTVTCVFDTREHFLYEMEAWDNVNNRVYRWIHPDYIKAYKKACKKHDVRFENAFDDVNFTDLDVEADILEKARAISNEEEYDTRIQMAVDFTDVDMLQYMKLVHQLDITFNELVERALREAIDFEKLRKEEDED
jgi:hypothetical protein